MTEKKEIKGEFKYQQDSKNFHRYLVRVEGEINGSLYIPKDTTEFPDRIVLERVNNKGN